jgi:hypothetical protein
MPTYAEAVLTDNPLIFWRLDEESGTVMADSSGNGHHGTYYDDAAFGFPSPIETDSSSSAIGGRVGEGGLAAKPINNLAIEGWIYVPTSDAVVTMVAGIGQPGAGGGIFIVYDSGNILARFSTDGTNGTTVDLTYPVPVLGVFYHVVLSRNGVQLELIVNGALADVETISADPITSIYTSHPWRVGVAGVGNIFAGVGTDEIAIYETPLTVARALAHYEAGLNRLLLTGYSNVISSAILYSDIEPDPISFPFRHNWTDTLIERISFATGVSTAIKGYESANAQRIKPRREIEISQITRNDTERRMLRAKLNAHQNRKWLVPMLDDREQLTVPIASDATTIPTDTLYKDYEIGGWVGIRQLNDAGEIVTWEELVIGSFTNTEITLSTAVVNDYPSPEVYPVRRAILDASIAPRGHTDSVEEVSILARLLAEDEQVIPHRIIEWTPMTTYRSFEIFPFAEWPNDWSELRDCSIDRAREDVDYEFGSFVTESDTNAASETFSWRIILDTKQKQAEFLGWFYARAGSLNYLWVPTMQRDFEIVSVAGNDLIVKGHNYSENFSGSEFRRDLAFIYNDNSIIIRRIESVLESGANEVLDLDNSVPTLTNLRSVSYLLFCRLDNDTIERASETDTKARFAWLFREMLISPA